jgi:hypothetical protein
VGGSGDWKQQVGTSADERSCQRRAIREDHIPALEAIRDEAEINEGV